MHIDRDRFLEEGYLILPQVIPPKDLGPLRQSCERLLDQQQAVWAQQRGSDDPPGGEWEKSSQPRVMAGRLADRVDRHSIAALEIWTRPACLCPDATGPPPCIP